MDVKHIEMKHIIIRENHRTNIQDTNLNELMASIKQNGLKQPVGVEDIGKNKFALVYGHRRYLAFEKLGYTKIPCVVTKEVDEKQSLILNLTENMQRNDPSFAELGRVIEKLERLKLTHSEISVRLGVPEKTIKKIITTYKGIPLRHRAKVKFMGKGGARNGGIPHVVAQHIAQIKKHHGLNDQACDTLFDHVAKAEMSKDDITNLSILLNNGLTLDKALNKMKDYNVYSVSVVANKHMIAKLISEHKCNGIGMLFKKIIYGEIPGIQKPDFIKLKESPMPNLELK